MRRRLEPQINMAPLIDIVFLLLIFFIYTVNMTGQPLDVDIDLPASAAGGGPDQDRRHFPHQERRLTWTAGRWNSRPSGTS